VENEDGQRKKLYKFLGDLPDRKRPISCRLISRERKDGYWLEKLVLDLSGRKLSHFLESGYNDWEGTESLYISDPT